MHLSEWLLLTNRCLYLKFVDWMSYESILKGFHERTLVLIGLWQSGSKGSRGASNKQGGEGKEMHDRTLSVEIL